MSGPEYARATERAKTGFAVIGDEELVCRGGLEALRAVPGHVLDHEQSAVRDQDVVEHAVADDGAVEALDDARQDGEAAGRAIVRVVDEDVCGCTLLPINRWGIDSRLDVASVEVDACAVWEVVERSGEA